MGPSIETERLRLRPWTLSEADVAAAHRIYGDPEVVRHIGGEVMLDLDASRAHLEMRLERRARWRGRFGAWAAELRATGEVVGTALMRPLPDAEGAYTEDVEIGWHLARERWGQGYATELGQALARHARAAEGLGRLHVVTEPGNHRSFAVARRLGFIPRGRTGRYYSGLEVEHLVMSLRAPSPTVFETDRLRIREWRTDDADVRFVLEMYGDPEVARFVGGPLPFDVEKQRARMAERDARYALWRGRYGVWAVERRDDGVPLGTALLKAIPDAAGELTDDFEVGWHVARAHWRRGYATEMGRGLVEHAKRLGELRKVHALVDAPNRASIEVARRLGFAHRGETTAYYEGDRLEHYALELVEAW